MHKAQYVAVLGIPLLALLSFTLVTAWTGPTAAPPGNNVPAPVNVGTTNQVKNGGLGVNSLAVYGNAILNGVGRYFNFGSTAGTSGYGIRDNGGLLEFKNSGGSLESLQTTVFNLVAGTGSWTTSGNNIYNNNTASVGIGTASPGAKLDVAGEVVSDTIGSGGGNIRMISVNYGVFFRTNGANTYLLPTNPGNQYGTWNGLRSFYVNDATGAVTFGTSAVFSNNVVVGSATLQTDGNLYMPWKGQWLSTALGNKIDFNTWGPGSTYYGTNGDIYLVWRGQWLSTVLSTLQLSQQLGPGYVYYLVTNQAPICPGNSVMYGLGRCYEEDPCYIYCRNVNF